MRDEVVLHSGTRIMCTILQARDGTLEIETEFSESFSIDTSLVASVKSAEPILLKMSDDRLVKTEQLMVSNGELILDESIEELAKYTLDDLDIVNPAPWELGEGYEWTGSVGIDFKIERGNSNIDELDYRLETFVTSLRDRYTFRARGEYDSASGELNADNTALQGKYDYFLENSRYWGLQVRAFKDKFQDIELRYLVGPYYGIEFFSLPVFTLSGELGASYVNETFITAEDQAYPAVNWSISMSSDILGADSRLFLDQLGVVNLNRPSDVLLITSTGLTYPLFWGFDITGEIKLDYDTGAVEGVEELDQTYSLRLGYSW